MINSKQIAEKFHMFINLLNHIDDYIRNKKERKDQLNVPKNIRIVLREVISSKITLHYFINKEESSSNKNTSSKSNEEIKNEIKYIKKVNPLSFNQKYLENTSLFYDSSNEIYIINYLSVEKIFQITNFCFKKILQKKYKEYQKLYEGENSKNFVLSNIYEKKIKKLIPNNNNNNPLCIKKQNIYNQILKSNENDKNLKKIHFPLCNLKKQISFLSYDEMEKVKRNNKLKRNSSLPLIFSANKNKNPPQYISCSMLSSSESSNNVLLNYKSLEICQQKLNEESEKRKIFYANNNPNILLIRNYTNEQNDNVNDKNYKKNKITVPNIKGNSNLRYLPKISSNRK